MTEGSIYRHMLRFALPVFISQLFQQFYNVADSIIVGKFLPTSALAAVSSSGNMIWLFTSFFEGVAVGAGVLISKNYGEKNKDAVDRSIHTSLAAAVVAGIILTVFGILLTPTLLRWINTDAQVIPAATSYFRLYFAGAMGLVMYNICRGIMMALGDSRRPLYYLIFSSVLNIALDYFFVGVCRFDVWSAGFATSVAQIVSAVLCLVQLSRKSNEYRVDVRKIRIHTKEMGQIFRYGVPSGVQNSVIGLANIIVLSQINTFGMIATATFGSCAKIEGFVFLPITSCSMAITTFVSQNLGARKYDRAKKGAAFGVSAAVFFAVVIAIFYVIFRVQIVSLFSKDPDVLALSKIQVGTMAPFYAFLALAHSIAAVCRGAGKASVPMYIMLGIWCVFRIAYILSVMHIFGEIRYIYWAYPITWILSDILFVYYYFKSDWVHGFEKNV